MTIKGLGTSGVPSPDPRRADGATAGKRPGQVGSPAGDQGATRVRSSDADVLELSADALSGQRAAGMPPQGTMSPERLQQIAARIADGSYDRPEVQDVVLARLAPELDGQGGSQG